MTSDNSFFEEKPTEKENISEQQEVSQKDIEALYAKTVSKEETMQKKYVSYISTAIIVGTASISVGFITGVSTEGSIMGAIFCALFALILMGIFHFFYLHKKQEGQDIQKEMRSTRFAFIAIITLIFIFSGFVMSQSKIGSEGMTTQLFYLDPPLPKKSE